MVMKFVMAAVLLTLTGATANAAFVQGELNIGGTAVVTAEGLDYVPPVGDGDGTILTLFGNTGTFAPLPLGSEGTILDRTEVTQPVGQTLSIPDYLVLSALPNVRFRLEYIAPGSFGSGSCFAAPANGQNCTLPPSPTGALSPYNFNNYIDATAGLSSSASFSVRGTVWDVSTPDLLSNFNGVFTATFLGTSFQENIATALGGGEVTAPFSASFTATPIPEPSTFLIMGAGLVGLSLRLRRSLK
jgi:hypothetical protein